MAMLLCAWTLILALSISIPEVKPQRPAFPTFSRAKNIGELKKQLTALLNEFGHVDSLSFNKINSWIVRATKTATQAKRNNNWKGNELVRKFLAKLIDLKQFVDEENDQWKLEYKDKGKH